MTVVHPSRSLLQELVEDRSGPCVSIYFPLQRSSPGGGEDRVLWRSLVRAASRRLQGRDRILAELRSLESDEEFWREPGHGTGVFAAPGFLRSVRLEQAVPQRLEIGSRFVVAPLVVTLPPVERAFVLALSRNAVRLLEVDPDGVRRLEPAGLPHDMQEALGIEQYDKSIQVHSGSGGGLARQPAVVHGHGDDDMDRMDRDLRNYFRRVIEGLLEVPRLRPEALRSSGERLVLACVGEHVPLFRQVWNGPGLVTGLSGSPDHLDDRALAEGARRVLAEYAEAERERLLERQQELGDRRRVSRWTEGIIAAADRGRVETLLVAPGAVRWGTYEPDRGRAVVHPRRLRGDEDLVDLAVSRTLAQGGTVLLLPSERADEDVLSAVYRY